MTNWLMIFCQGRKRRKFPKFWKYQWVISPSPEFLKITERPYYLLPTAIKSIVQVWGKKKKK